MTLYIGCSKKVLSQILTVYSTRENKPKSLNKLITPKIIYFRVIKHSMYSPFVSQECIVGERRA